jgi:LuxR family transcriptional regulator of csgAB operon
MHHVLMMSDQPGWGEVVARIEVRLTVKCASSGLNGATSVAALPPESLVVVDAEGLSGERVGEILDMVSRQAPTARTAVINLAGDTPLESLVLQPRLMGLFVDLCAEDVLVKGIAGMLCGEYWLPRKVMEHFFERYRGMQVGRPEMAAALTPKEQRILQLIAQGKANQDIADTLFVSKHTVKTHIYNLFRKINVNSRSQAVLWAIRHLDDAPEARAN